MKTLSQWLLIGVAMMGLLASDAIGESKGHAWLHKHGTVLLAGATHDLQKSDFDIETYRAVGYNALWDANPSGKLFDLADEHKIPWFCSGRLGRLESPYAGGIIMFDEPQFKKVSSIDGSERIFRPHLSGLPGPLGKGIGGPSSKELRFLNLIGMDINGGTSAKLLWGDDSNPGYTYEQYVQDVLNIWQPDILMHDHYPFRENEHSRHHYLANNFYERMGIIRAAALKRGIPYWKYCQAYGKPHDIAVPSKSDTRLELFAGLAYGFTGFVHYWYDQPHDRNRGLVRLFFDNQNNPTDFYRHVVEAVPDIANLGGATIHLLSTDIRYAPCRQTKQIPKGSTSWNDPQRSLSFTDPYQKDIKVSGQADKDDFVIGYFLDGQGERYFMPVNVRHDPSAAKNCAETVEIEFAFADSGIKRLLRLNRKSGQVETIDDSSPIFTAIGPDRYRLTLTLPGGTGDLFKYDTGSPFAGVNSLMDPS